VLRFRCWYDWKKAQWAQAEGTDWAARAVIASLAFFTVLSNGRAQNSAIGGCHIPGGQKWYFSIEPFREKSYINNFEFTALF